MTTRPSGRAVLWGFAPVELEGITVADKSTEEILMSVSQSVVQRLSIGIAQHTSRTFLFVDEDAFDYTPAIEITFDIWTKPPHVDGAVSLLSFSLTGGEITLTGPYWFQLTIDDTQSALLPPGDNYCEVWMTLPDNIPRLLGAGRFRVIDTRKYD